MRLLEYSKKLYKNIKPKRAYIFPALATVGLVTATLLGMHGSSIGVLDSLLDYNHSNQTAGEPRVVRSDEWFVNTPFVLSQSNNDYPLNNKDVGSGQDMSVVVDVPYKDWSVLFRPQNLAFFILPAINAFTFKWWLVAYLLLMAVYTFVLYLFSKKYLLASLLAVFVVFSPFVQWWYQSITILPMAYALFLIVVVLKLTENKKPRYYYIGYGALLSYLAACFAFIMYPPFQVVCALFTIFMLISIYFAQNKFKDIWQKNHILKIGAPLLVGILPVVIFIILHHNVISVITNTVYPGSRDVAAGGMQPAYLLGWPFSYLILRQGPMTILGNNQSEVSRFLFTGILIMPTLLFLLYKERGGYGRKYWYTLIGLVVLFLIFILNLFVPFASGVYKLFGLNLVPHVRVVMSFGLINFTLLALAFALPTVKRFNLYHFLSKRVIATFIFSVIIMSISVAVAKHAYTLPSVGRKEGLAIVIAFSLVTALLVHPWLKIRYLGLAIITSVSLAVSITVNPIYRGFGGLLNSDLSKAVRSISEDDDSAWIATDRMNFEPIPLAVGAKTYSGVEAYPQLDIWQKYFPGKENIYNRFAHVTFIIDEKSSRSIKLLQGDSFEITTNSCDAMLKELSINHIIANSEHNKTYACFQKQQEFTIGKNKVAIFTRKQ